MSNQPRYVDWSRGSTIRKVVGAAPQRTQGAAARAATPRPKEATANPPAALEKAVSAARAALRHFEDAKIRGVPSEIAARRSDLEVAKSVLEGERKLAIALDAVAHAPRFRYGF